MKPRRTRCLAELHPFRAVQAEADGAGRLAAVEVINEQRLNSLSHEMTVIPSGDGKHTAVLRLTSYRPVMPMPALASAIPAACNASAARRHVVTALLPATVTPGHSSAEAHGAPCRIFAPDGRRISSSGPAQIIHYRACEPLRGRRVSGLERPLYPLGLLAARAA